MGVTVTWPLALVVLDVGGGTNVEPEGGYETIDAPTAPGTFVVPVTELSNVQFWPS